MVKKLNLTQQNVGKLELPPPRVDKDGKQHTAQVIYYDTRTAGLGVRVSSKGTRSWVHYRKVHGRPKLHTLARWPGLTLSKARELADDLNSKIARRRANPRAAEREERGQRTFGEVFVDYLEEAKENTRAWRGLEAVYNSYLKSWANRQLNSITQDDVRRLRRQVSRPGMRRMRDKAGKTMQRHTGGKNAANKMLGLIHLLYNWVGLTGDDNPAQGVKKFPVTARERFLQPDELPRFFHALREYSNLMLRDFFLLALFTGARRGNLVAMRWKDINMEWGTWTIPGEQHKNGDPVTLPIHPAAKQVLESRLEAANGSPWVFPAEASRTGHLQEPRKAWAAILERAGLDDLRIHDLRRTFGSYQAAANVSLHTIGKSLGHRSGEATRIYARLNLEPVRAAVHTGVDSMLAAEKGQIALVEGGGEDG